jgi:nucleoside-diphosphate-sugar epimerase
MPRKLIIGCGYLGHRLAQSWFDDGDQIFATTRRTDRAAQWLAQGWNPIVWDVTDPQVPAWPEEVDTLVFAVGLDRQATAAIDEVYVQGLRHLLSSLPPGLERLIYVSSTGVYGQQRSAWLDEDSPCEPTRAGGRACLAAEGLLQASAVADRAIILRLAGIYGPGRLPQRDKLARHEPLPGAPQGYLNLIHVDDAVQAIRAAERLQKLPDLFVISDGSPVLRSDYYSYFAQLAKLPPPRFAPPAVDEASTSRAQGDKRVNNAKMRRELPFTLRYPDYRSGLAAIVGDSLPGA